MGNRSPTTVITVGPDASTASNARPGADQAASGLPMTSHCMGRRSVPTRAGDEPMTAVERVLFTMACDPAFSFYYRECLKGRGGCSKL